MNKDLIKMLNMYKDFIKDSIEKGKPCDTSMFNILMIDETKADTKITIRGKRA